MSPLTEPVLAWGEPRLRDLPWRRTRDPWAILVSEVMLQQTQVPRVIPKYLAFLDALPTAPSCAAVPLGDVLRLWHGLGYPRRARNLHLAAQRVAELGRFPDTLDELLALPGVGAYTARAVLAFAFEADAAVVDTNIARVYARVEGRRLTARQVQTVADGALAAGESWAWNQTIMDLGAVVCRPANPACATCPIEQLCAWHGVGDDPAVGSAGVSTRQSPFDGSERQARGRLMAALQAAPVDVASVAAVMSRDEATSQRLLLDLLRDGLVTVQHDTITLPG
ncbi:MAG: A/G-specific adenine glycosylase [Ilumatobacteraceae bacterium]|nr:A/G-specific adenine glycosylase [Ilumatobacteraceae bacterium]